MSWEIDRETKSPCGCGQGYVYRVDRSDDWSRWEERVSLHCTECEKNYVEYTQHYHRSGMSETSVCWVKKEDYARYLESKKEAEEAYSLAITQTNEYLRQQYLGMWMALFQDVKRNKKAVWGKLRELGLNVYSYSSFCKEVARLDEHIESYVQYSNYKRVLGILGVNDENLGIFQASSKATTARYDKVRSEMFKNAFH